MTRKKTSQLTRREFLSLGAGAVAAMAFYKLDIVNMPPEEANAPAPMPLQDDAYPPTHFDREVYTLCEQCVWRCGVRAKVIAEQVYKLEGNGFHPHSRGMLCPRGQAGVATLYDPDRLKYPLIRSGPRGSGQHVRRRQDLCQHSLVLVRSVRVEAADGGFLGGRRHTGSPGQQGG